MDSSTQETIYSDPKWFFSHRKEDSFRHISWAVKDIMTSNKDFFNQVEMDDELLKQFLVANKDIMQMVETPRNMQPKRTSSTSSDNSKRSEQSTITQDKKRKQEHLADNFNNSNLILTSYYPQQEEQAQLLDLIVYDIPAKWDSYTLLGNLSFWGKIVSISTRCHKKYLSARVRLIPNHECLKAYNGGEWTVRLSSILVRWFPAS
ncbi:hypothetical protein RclHR1_00270001 [Rhizophagus clarus]|uniref:Uncharacterized protein n=1 Tax=Rhizophagus clarus TaxID=94130 RepID=A0A2Z6R2H4_9GLOM|nr:hypothetical protein RclHR1_00270001 [Rhizophagus clarus]